MKVFHLIHKHILFQPFPHNKYIYMSIWLGRESCVYLEVLGVILEFRVSLYRNQDIDPHGGDK